MVKTLSGSRLAYCVTPLQGSVSFPANFMLIGAMNPCPCGYYGDPFRQCTCPSSLVSRYQRRISGPFVDRVDIFIEVPHIDYEKLADDRLGEKSEKVQARVKAARSLQRERFNGTRLTCNTEMTPIEVREFCQAEESAQSHLKASMKQLYLSARAFHRILKLARIIADLENTDIIKAHHLAEAIQYRPRSSL
ncbi:ATP-binding protein [Chloroflexota bacterium]